MSELMVVVCPNCRKQLKAPQDRAGKTVKCPQCQSPFVLTAQTPAAAAPTQPVVVQAAAPVAAAPIVVTQVAAAVAPTVAVATQTRQDAGQWYLQIPSGERFGPIVRSELDEWYEGGRINGECQIFCEGWSQWKWAAEIYPALSPTIAAQATSFSGIGGSTTVENPYIAAQAVGVALAGGTTASAAGKPDGAWHSTGVGFKISKFAYWTGAGTLTFVTLMMLFLSLLGPSSPPKMSRTATPQSMQQYQKEQEAFERSARSMAGTAAWIGMFIMWSLMLTTVSIIVNLTAWFVTMEIPRATSLRGTLGLAIGLSLGAILILVFMLQTLFAIATGGGGGPNVGTFAKVMVSLSAMAYFTGFACHAMFSANTAKFLGRPNAVPQGFLAAGLNLLALVFFAILFFAVDPSSTAGKALFYLLMASQIGALAISGLLCHTNALLIRQLRYA